MGVKIKETRRQMVRLRQLSGTPEGEMCWHSRCSGAGAYATEASSPRANWDSSRTTLKRKSLLAIMPTAG